jgi:hypothetical protein
VVLRNAGQFIDEDAPADIAGAITDWWTAEVSPPEVVPRTQAKPAKPKAPTKAAKPKSTKASKPATPKARAARKPPSRP